MRSDGEGASFVGGGDEPEQQLGAGVVERGEPDFVDQDEVDPQEGLDDLADGVVGEAAVEGFDEIGGGEVADPLSGIDGGVAEGDEEVGSCRCRRVRPGTTFSLAAIHSRLVR